MKESNKEKREKAQVELVRTVFSDPNVRELLWWIQSFCGVYNANGEPDEYRRGISEGKRRVGLYLEDLLSVVDTAALVGWRDEMTKKEKLLEQETEEDLKNRRYHP